MLRCVVLVAAFFAFVSSAVAQRPDNQPIRMTLQPAAVPDPALKYRLLPAVEDVCAGNAVQLYYRSFSPEWWSNWGTHEFFEKVSEQLQTPLAKLPREELKFFLGLKPLHEVDLGARREYCDWEFTARVRKEGFRMLLGDIQSLRRITTLLAVRARLQMANGEYDEAVYSLQTGFALARHVADAPLAISGVIGISFATEMGKQVEELIQAPGSPNLYWALTALPAPCIDLRRGLDGERLTLLAEMPMLKDLETARLSPQQQQTLESQTLRLMGMAANETPPSFGSQVGLAALSIKAYPEAKRALIARGKKVEDVEAMSVLQVVLIHSFHEFERLRDEMFKWYGLPYAEAQAGRAEADKLVRASSREGGMARLFVQLLPAYEHLYAAQARLDRQIAILRCIEAIRLFSAAHAGNLPAALTDITEVPVPLDPVTGKAFNYKAAANVATLSAPPWPGAVPPYNTLTYELTMK
jgi:hypothetical protein